MALRYSTGGGEHKVRYFTAPGKIIRYEIKRCPYLFDVSSYTFNEIYFYRTLPLE